jgi:putative pyruvate formate lyase activating enzyme
VRHLVLPGDLANTEEVLGFIAREISPRTCINVMDQYRPVYRAHGHPEIDRPITRAEYRHALEVMRRYGLWHADEPGPTWG